MSTQKDTSSTGSNSVSSVHASSNDTYATLWSSTFSMSLLVGREGVLRRLRLWLRLLLLLLLERLRVHGIW